MKEAAQLDLRQYRYFQVLGEQLHFAKAAERLGISQPALSQQIRQMERAVGSDLLVRNKRQVELTEVGAVLLEQAKSLLQQADYARNAVVEAAHGNMGQVSIMYVASAMLAGHLPRIIYNFRKQRPAVQVLLQEMDMPSQAKAIAQKTCDVGFIRLPLPDLPDGITCFNLLEEPMVVALRTTHARAQQKKINLRDLENDTFICTHRQPGMGFYALTLALCRHAGFSPKTEVFGSQTSILVSMVAAGFGVTLIPASTQFYAPLDVVFIPLESNPVQSTFSLMHASNNRSPSVQAFLETARIWSRSLIAAKK